MVAGSRQGYPATKLLSKVKIPSPVTNRVTGPATLLHCSTVKCQVSKFGNQQGYRTRSTVYANKDLLNRARLPTGCMVPDRTIAEFFCVPCTDFIFCLRRSLALLITYLIVVYIVGEGLKVMSVVSFFIIVLRYHVKKKILNP